MKVTRFSPEAPLIFVRDLLFGPRKNNTELRLAVDTAAEETLIIPEMLEDVGYSARHGEAITVIRSAIGRELGYMLRVERLRCLGHEVKDFRVHAHDLVEGMHIDGLLGLSFLRQFNYEVRSAEGRLLVERV